MGTINLELKISAKNIESKLEPHTNQPQTEEQPQYVTMRMKPQIKYEDKASIANMRTKPQNKI